MLPGLFRPTLDVREPSRAVSALPVSIFIHVLVVLAVVVIPLFATDVLPLVRSELDSWMPAVAAPEVPPAPVPATRRVASLPQGNPDAAPTVVPNGIAPDDGLERSVRRPDDLQIQPGLVEGSIEGGRGLEVEPPPPVPAPVKVYRAGGLIRQPVKVVDVRPVYPEVAQRAHIEGVVIIEAVIGPTGDVQEARVLRSPPLLGEAALAAVRQWKFTPTLLDGVPVPVVMTVTVNFTLQR